MTSQRFFKKLKNKKKKECLKLKWNCFLRCQISANCFKFFFCQKQFANIRSKNLTAFQRLPIFEKTKKTNVQSSVDCDIILHFKWLKFFLIIKVGSSICLNKLPFFSVKKCKFSNICGYNFITRSSIFLWRSSHGNK